MQEIFDQIVNFFIENLQNFGPLFGVFIIILESVFPILPLAVFLSFNYIAFGPIMGFLINWTATCFGCLISFYLFKKGFGDKWDKDAKKDNKVKELLKYIKKLSFSSLVLLLALPFTPAFAVNIAAGLSNMDSKKFIFAVLLAKPSIIFLELCGYECNKSNGDIIRILQMVVIVIITYFISLIIQNKIKEK